MGWPQGGTDTPHDSLYSENILGGRDLKAKQEILNETGLRQPRVEDRLKHEEIYINRHVPKTDVDMVKLQSYLEPTRDSEIFFQEAYLDIAALARGVPILTFETFARQRLILRHISVQVFDGLLPSGITVAIQVEGETKKLVAVPSRTAVVPVGFPPSPPPTTPGSVSVGGIPDAIRNWLFEIYDRRDVTFLIDNAIAADRFVCIRVWGWFVSFDDYDNAVYR